MIGSVKTCHRCKQQYHAGCVIVYPPTCDDCKAIENERRKNGPCDIPRCWCCKGEEPTSSPLIQRYG